MTSYNFLNYTKLIKFTCYRGVPYYLKQRKFLYNFNCKNIIFSKNFIFFDYYIFLIFLYKLRSVIQSIVKKNGRFVFINKHIPLINILKQLIPFQNQLYFNFDKSLFTNVLFIKKFILKGILVNKSFLYYKKISFVILLLNRVHHIQEFSKLQELRRFNTPLFFLSQEQYLNDYFVPTFGSIRCSYFWSFILLKIIFEENKFYKQIR